MSDDYLRLRSPELSAALQNDVPVIICLGAIEQHGDHLPVGTDTIQAEGLARKAKEVLDARGIRLLLGPSITFGLRQFPSEAPRDRVGTVSISSRLFQSLVKEVANELIRHGFRRLYLLIGHAENDAPAQLAAKELSEETDAVVTTINWLVVSGRLNKGSSAFPSPQGHGGAGETSRMMVLLPDSVDLKAGKAFYPKQYGETYEGADPPYVGGAVGRYKTPPDSFSSDFAGIIGSPEESSAEAGVRLIDMIGTWIADVVEFEESIWKGPPRLASRA